MKYTIVTLLLMTSTVTTVAVRRMKRAWSSEGANHRHTQPIPVPTTASPAGPLSKLFQPSHD